MNKYTKYITRANIVKALAYGIAGLTIVADWANEGLDILKYASNVIGGG